MSYNISTNHSHKDGGCGALSSGCIYPIVVFIIITQSWFRIIDWLEIPLIFIVFPFLQKIILYAFHHHNYKGWLRASFLGIAVTYLMAFLFRDLLLSYPQSTSIGAFFAVVYFFGGGAFLIMSISQWLVLRRHIQRAWQWIAFNVVAILVATFTIKMELGGLASILWSIAVYGLIIGIGLGWVAYLPLREKSKAKRGI